jgi:hypothetical protein
MFILISLFLFLYGLFLQRVKSELNFIICFKHMIVKIINNILFNFSINKIRVCKSLRRNFLFVPLMNDEFKFSDYALRQLTSLI